LLANPEDYTARAEFTWAATLALNGITKAGTNQLGYPNHMIEHSLSAFFDIPHGAGLAIAIPAWMKWFHTQNPTQFKRFAENIFGKNSAEEGIEALENWFAKIGAPIRLQDVSISEKFIPALAENATRTANIWGMGDIYTQEVIEYILQKA
jgi:alcohol dehydrogenase YqhD (iron-dependent ADH family)